MLSNSHYLQTILLIYSKKQNKSDNSDKLNTHIIKIMLKQIFKKQIPINILYDLLELISLKTDRYYVIDLTAYKKMIFQNLHEAFLTNVKEYYHKSKRFYIEREFTYNSFTNIIRQMCKSNEITFQSSIKYNSSKYNIDYFIYF